MKAEQLADILKLYPKANIHVWGDSNTSVEITYEKEGDVVINLKKKTA